MTEQEAERLMPLERVWEARKEGQAEVARAFAAWAAKNEIGPVPLDWAWFGEITRRFLPEYEHGHDSRGACSVCQRVMHVRLDGLLRAHHDGKNPSAQVLCAGSFKPPIPT